jgi:hypothetical protein
MILACNVRGAKHVKNGFRDKRPLAWRLSFFSDSVIAPVE